MRPAPLALAAALLAGLAAGTPAVSLPAASAQDGRGDKGDKGDKEGKGEKKGEPKKDPPKKDPPGDGGKDGGKETGKKDDGGKRLSEGDEVGSLSLDLLAGGSWTAASARGRIVVLVFAAEFSAESLEALKGLGDAKGATARSGADRIGILRDADAEKARRLVKEHSLVVSIALDPRRKAYDRLAKAGLPYTVILDGQGRIAASTSGFDDDAVARKVEELKKRREKEREGKEKGK